MSSCQFNPNLQPLIEQLQQRQELIWLNPQQQPAAEGLAGLSVTRQDVEQAAARLTRFAPLIAAAFPETQAKGGIIESDITELAAMQARLTINSPLTGRLWLKKDSHLPISGSIKARGGIYEVLAHAEQLAMQAGLLNHQDNYLKLLQPEYRDFFSDYKISVGSTGNLGLSIGIIGAKLGFQVYVHMSSDARQWKKVHLRRCGATVIEHQQDYGLAVAQGRELAENDPSCYFIDDENSQRLFLGYAVAALRLVKQFEAQKIIVDHHHPLFVYLPCGVGGGPGGVAFGLKLVFGDAVHCFFAEPTHSPCMLLGISTGLHQHICVQDIGLDNQTAADGLAVGRPSGFIGQMMQGLIAGCFTVSDATLFHLLRELNDSQGIQLEPSALAGMPGPHWICNNADYLHAQGITASQLQQATHLVWATGGSMVPPDEMARYLGKI